MQKLSGLAIALAVVLLAGSMATSAYALPSINLSGKHNVGQHVENEGTAKINSIDIFVKNKKKQDDVTVQIVKDGSVLATATVATSDLSKKITQLTADFGGIELTGDYDIVVSGKGAKLLKEKSASGSLFAKNDYAKWDLKYSVNGDKEQQEPQEQPAQTGSITIYAYRMASEQWGPTFTGAGAQMYFVLYNSTGDIVWTGFGDENGQAITGLKAGEKYYVYPTDCNSCHESDHDVVFDHWQDGSTERPRAVSVGESASAYYKFVPHS
jgi:hypothetical protein